MAPEIVRHNGEEEYTEKVDCFSFGMFLYEMIALRPPFEGSDCVKDHILDGGRPMLSHRVSNTFFLSFTVSFCFRFLFLVFFLVFLVSCFFQPRLLLVISA